MKSLMRKKELLRVLATYVIIRSIGLILTWSASALRDKSFMTIFSRWDSQWYLSIAQNGYGFEKISHGRTLSNEAFFPLFPLLERFIHSLTHLNYVGAGVLISSLSGIWAAAMIYLVVRGLASKETALLTVILWSIYPLSFVDTLAYTETLFTALAATAIYFWQRDQMKSSALAALLAGMTRPSGLAIALAISLSALYMVIKNPSVRKNLDYYFAIIVPPLGWLGYIFYLAQKRNSLIAYFSIQSHWGNGFDGGKVFVKWIRDFLISDKWLLGILILISCAILLLALKRLFEITDVPAILIYTTMLVALSLTTQGYFGSKPRYLLPAFPLFIPAALYISRLSKAKQRAVVLALATGGLVYGAIAATGFGPP